MPGGVRICEAKQPADLQNDLLYAVNPPVRVHKQDRLAQRTKEAQLGMNSAAIPMTGLPRLSADRSAIPPLIREFVLASEKSRAAQRRLAAGRDEEAVRLFAESLAQLIGVQKSSPDFAPEVLSQKIREVRLQLEKSLGR